MVHYTPRQGIYAGGTYRLRFDLRDTPNYPFEPPQCHCETPIWHPDIANVLDHDTPNNVCVSYLKPLGSVHGNPGRCIIPHHETFSTTIQPPYSSTKG
jgi:ubiquitin-protein ligase